MFIDVELSKLDQQIESFKASKSIELLFISAEGQIALMHTMKNGEELNLQGHFHICGNANELSNIFKKLVLDN